jgi:pimeloyl-ACP methyl ester carboxylesterase
MKPPLLLGLLVFALSGANLPASSSESVLSVDHYVRVKSIAPAMKDQFAQIYVRERVAAKHAQGGAAGVVLFIHGAGTPAEVAFDTPHSDYSWMAYLANAGYDVFSMDMEGYGRSTRPTVMNDPANLATAQQAQFAALLGGSTAASYKGSATTMASDWHDIGAVIDYLRKLRRVEKVTLFGWSQGGPRAHGYTAQHPEQVERLVLLAPGYNRNGSATAPAPRPDAVTFNTQNKAEFDANWDRQLGCPDQFDPAVRAVVWSEMLASDPVGRTWGTGVRRAPTVPSWGYNKAVVAANRTPTLMIAGAHDAQVPPSRVRELYEDLASPDKVFIELACSSHNAMWERNHLLMFAASLEWLQKGTVNGQKNAALKIGF